MGYSLERIGEGLRFKNIVVSQTMVDKYAVYPQNWATFRPIRLHEGVTQHMGWSKSSLLKN